MMQFDPEKITFFAKTDARAQEVPFGIKAKDRQRHMYVVGKTGMGKSTLLENMAVQDIQNGEGMAFIDPHGSAAETLLEYVPEHRVNDVIYFAPFDLDNPISFNVMEDVGEDKRHLVVSGLMSTFKKIWVDAWSARMEYILTNALLALIEYPDTTLLSVNRLFSDKHYRNQVVNYIKDPAVKAFWTEEFAGYTDRFAAEALPAIQNKIGQFTGNPLIRNIIGQPHSSFDIRDIMDNKKILIMNLSKGLVGETNANLLGSMLTTRIYLAAMSRADLPVQVMKTMPNFYFYVDEFQSFANATFANILSEARKYHLNLIIAHQYIAQMEEEVRDAVFGNVGTTITFRVGPFDAELLEQVFTPRFMAADLVNLGFAQIYLTLMIDGIGSQPFSASTLPPIKPPHISCRDMVVAASRRNYTKPRAEVEQIIVDLHTPVEVLPKNNSKTDSGQQNNNSSRQNNHNNKSDNNNRPANNKSSEYSRPERQNKVDTKTNSNESDNNQSRPRPSRGEERSRIASSRTEEQKSFPGRTPSVGDLRSILAKIVKDTDTKPDRTDRSNKSEKPEKLEKFENSKYTEPAREATQNTKDINDSSVEDSKRDLKAILAKTLVQHEVKTNAKKNVSRVSSNENTSSQTVSAQSPKNPNTSQILVSPPPASNHDEVAKMAAEADALFDNLTKQPASPDPKEVAKILKGPRERSPFR